MPKKTMTPHEVARLRSIALKGGLTTQARYPKGHEHWKQIGARGGANSKGTPKRRKGVEEEPEPMMEACSMDKTLEDILAELNR